MIYDVALVVHKECVPCVRVTVTQNVYERVHIEVNTEVSDKLTGQTVTDRFRDRHAVAACRLIVIGSGYDPALFTLTETDVPGAVFNVLIRIRLPPVVHVYCMDTLGVGDI